MNVPNPVLLYVEDPLQGAAFCERLLGTSPATVFPTYAAFAFENGLHLGLWSTQARDFVSSGTGHRSELAFMVDDEDEVRALRDAWQASGVEIEQHLATAVFGLTFVALDPDGHRIRVCLPDC